MKKNILFALILVMFLFSASACYGNVSKGVENPQSSFPATPFPADQHETHPPQYDNPSIPNQSTEPEITTPPISDNPKTIKYKLQDVILKPVEISENSFQAGSDFVGSVKYIRDGAIMLKSFSIQLSENELNFEEELINIAYHENGLPCFLDTEERLLQSVFSFEFTAPQDEELNLFISVEMYSYYYNFFNINKGFGGNKKVNADIVKISQNNLEVIIKDFYLFENLDSSLSAGMKFDISLIFNATVIE